MKDWILENTVVTQQQYDYFLDRVISHQSNDGLKRKKWRNVKNHPMIKIQSFTVYNPKLITSLSIKRTANNMYGYKGLEFLLITDYAEQNNIELPEKLKNDLLDSRLRAGKCDYLSIELMSFFKNSRVLIIRIDDCYIEDEPVTHVVVEIQTDKGSYILDATKNLFMETKQYFNMMGRVEVLNVVSSEKAKKDIDELISLGLGSELLGAEYFAFDEEIMNAVNRR